MRGYSIISQFVVDSLKTEKSIIVKTERKECNRALFFFFKCSMLPLDLGKRVLSAVGPGLFFFLLWLHPLSRAK